MQVVQASSIGSYADTEAITRFVRAALRLEPRTADLLGRRDRELLVVVKPNWVQQAHEYRQQVWEPVITHPAVVSSRSSRSSLTRWKGRAPSPSAMRPTHTRISGPSSPAGT